MAARRRASAAACGGICSATQPPSGSRRCAAMLRARRFRRRRTASSRRCCRARSTGGASCSGGWAQEARDPIEELLNAALEFESTATPSLQRFLDWFDRGDVEIVRDPSAPLDAVRVMTAHGAKGLQAPLVILADATRRSDARAPRSVLKWTPEGPTRADPRLPRRARPSGAGRSTRCVASAEARELEEHWRLFYVAATRAEERLVIAGALGPRAKGVPPAASWYAAASAALTALGVEREDADARRLRGQRAACRRCAAEAARRAPLATAPALPAWARVPAPVEARPPRPLAPSSLGEDDGRRSAARRRDARRRRARAADPRAVRAAARRSRPIARAAAADRWLARRRRRRRRRRARARSSRGGVRRHRRSGARRRCSGPTRWPRRRSPRWSAAGWSSRARSTGCWSSADRVRVVDFKTGRRVPADARRRPAIICARWRPMPRRWR